MGTIEESFQSYIEEYFKKYPSLQNRVDFVGSILDREELFEEYRSAKIFALTSEIEGGTPNVISEALNGGCVIAITAIDGAVDATDYGRCGRISDIDDPLAFAKNLLQLIHSEKLEKLSNDAYEYGRTHFNMENIVEKLYVRLWGGIHE